MIDWDRCAAHDAAFFGWPAVRAAWDAMDPQVAHLAQALAREEMAHLAPACPGCRAPPAALPWISIGSSDAAWRAGDERCGWLILCPPCARQVAFLVDEAMTQGRRDGDW
jgi:hypothetical protein